MTIENLHEALSILLKEQGDQPIAVGHDQLWIGEYAPQNLSELELSRLDELGFLKMNVVGAYLFNNFDHLAEGGSIEEFFKQLS